MGNTLRVFFKNSNKSAIGLSGFDNKIHSYVQAIMEGHGRLSLESRLMFFHLFRYRLHQQEVMRRAVGYRVQVKNQLGSLRQMAKHFLRG